MSLKVTSDGLKVNDMNGLMDAAVSIAMQWRCRPWWRGQADKDWDLYPRLYREKLEGNETEWNATFCRKARVRHHHCPDGEFSPEWLFLAQHYDLPTRLMDWSESMMVALFFALEDPRMTGEAGCAIWAFQPLLLNSRQGIKGIVTPSHPDVCRLFRDAFVKPTPDRDPELRVIAINAQQIDPRQMVQQATFTVHGTGTPLNHLPEAQDALMRIIIPQEDCDYFRKRLELLGITRDSLFPDLANLAKEVRTLHFARPEQPSAEELADATKPIPLIPSPPLTPETKL